MALLKCKMCGANLNPVEGAGYVCCEYCGTQQTIPKGIDDKRAVLYERANHFRRNNEYDKAMSIYEQILNEDNTDAEAYWSLVLCRYGIVYVEDPASGKRIPTVNRIQFTSVFDDDNYVAALQYADSYQRRIYEEEAEVINGIQKKYLEISSKEAPFDVFICYKESDERGNRTPDSVLAQELYYELTEAGLKVFFSRITLEDKLGSAYEPYIFAALNSSKVMVVLGTKPEYFSAAWVQNEWSRFLALIKNGEKKTLVPAYRDMDPYFLPKELSHLQAQDMSRLGFMQDLIRGIKKIVGDTGAQRDAASPAAGNANPLLKRVQLFLADGFYDEASEYCEKILDSDPENAEAYLCKLLAEMRVPREHDLANCAQPLETKSSYKNALRFCDQNTAERLIMYNNQIKANLQRRASQQRQREEEQRRLDAQRAQAAASFRSMQEQKQRQLQQSYDAAKLESLKKDKKKYGCLGCGFLIFFWPVGLFFLYQRHKTDKEIRELEWRK